jgi:hypothetical protein
MKFKIDVRHKKAPVKQLLIKSLKAIKIKKTVIQKIIYCVLIYVDTTNSKEVQWI